MDGRYMAIGHVTMDEIWKGGYKEVRLGGSVAYGSLFASGLGYKAIIVSKIGRDFPEEFLEELRNEGVELHLKVSDHPTTRFVIRGENDHRNIILSSLCEPIYPDDLDYLEADVVHLGPVASEINEEVVSRSLSMGNIVLLDLQGIIRSFSSEGKIVLEGEKLDRIAGLDLAVHANEEEARAVTGEEDPLKAVEKLSDMFWLASVTLGMRGAIIASPEGLIIAKPPKIAQVDDVGAGDVFTAALGIALAKGDTFEDASRYAVAASSASTLYKGPSAISEAEIQKLMKGVSITWL